MFHDSTRKRSSPVLSEGGNDFVGQRSSLEGGIGFGGRGGRALGALGSLESLTTEPIVAMLVYPGINEGMFGGCTVMEWSWRRGTVQRKPEKARWIHSMASIS